MSRIGKKPIKLDSDVSVRIEENRIIITGPKGQLEYILPASIRVNTKDQEIKIERNNNNKQTIALHGLSRTIINNMATGVSKGFNKTLEIQGVGYRAQVNNQNNLILNVGYSHPINITPPPGIKITVEDNSKIIIAGINKAEVGQIAAQVREVRPPEPYKGKGIRYQDEIVKKKVGKAGK